MSEKTFEASRYLTKLNGRDYLEVKWRLLWLRTEHPEALVCTELSQLDMEKGFAMFKATVRIPGGGEATGWGTETSRDFGDFIEKAETKALGRALAALGYGTQFCEDFDFGREGNAQVVDSPVDRGRLAAEHGAMAAGGKVPQATPSQVKAIYAIAREDHRLRDDQVVERSKTLYGAEPARLSRQQASDFIDRLKAGAPGRQPENRGERTASV